MARSQEGDEHDLRRLQERVDELERQLAYVADAVLHWPTHPWIPGSEFLPDREVGRELRAIVEEHRTRPAADRGGIERFCDGALG